MRPSNVWSAQLPVIFSLVYILFPVPQLVVRRKLWPLFVAGGVAVWFCHRFLGLPERVSSDVTLIDVVLQSLQKGEEYLVDKAQNIEFLPEAIDWCWLVLKDFMGLLLILSMHRVWYRLCHYTVREWRQEIVQGVYEWSKEHIPAVQSFVIKIRTKTKEDMEKSIGKDPDRTVNRTLPIDGQPAELLLKQMQAKATSENKKWESGKLSGAVYPSDESHTQLMNDVYAAYSWANPLHPGVWPSVNQYEAEVVAMTASMLHGTTEVVGTTTSGGTESIVLAIRAHAQYYGKRRGITTPELICCSSAHASVDKACEMFQIRKVVIPCDPETFTLSPDKVEGRITSNTIMIYASAPSFPQGVIDPIPALSELALEYNVGLHVDACLGGFVLPFAQQLGHPVPKFDFQCPGVTSMSVDTHKYGYASKGTSVVLYRNQDLRHAQYFAYAQWSGGLYITPTIAGSRPGALSACAWAALMSIGESGYMSRVESILEASDEIASGIEEIDGLHLLGKQKPTMVVCFGSDDLNIYSINDAMSRRGWELNALQNPACMHVCVTLSFVNNVEAFLKDLNDAVVEVRKEGPDAKSGGSAAIYGMAGSMPAGPANEVLRCFTDLTLTP